LGCGKSQVQWKQKFELREQRFSPLTNQNYKRLASAEQIKTSKGTKLVRGTNRNYKEETKKISNIARTNNDYSGNKSRLHEKQKFNLGNKIIGPMEQKLLLQGEQ
jgi:hypothetical protein